MLAVTIASNVYYEPHWSEQTVKLKLRHPSGRMFSTKGGRPNTYRSERTMCNPETAERISITKQNPHQILIGAGPRGGSISASYIRCGAPGFQSHTHTHTRCRSRLSLDPAWSAWVLQIGIGIWCVCVRLDPRGHNKNQKMPILTFSGVRKCFSGVGFVSANSSWPPTSATQLGLGSDLAPRTLPDSKSQKSTSWDLKTTPLIYK